MFTLTISTGNEAFGDSEDSALQECARILRAVARKLDAGTDQDGIRDLNGNRVGEFLYEQEDDDA